MSASGERGSGERGPGERDGVRRLLGAVLVGGQSRRFGSPKARAVLHGVPLVERAVRALAPCCGAGVVAVGGSGDEAAGLVPGVGAVPDRRSGAGPLAGLEAALVEARERGAEGVVLLACDLPAVDWLVVAGLAQRWRGIEAPADGAVALSGPDGLQPLCGVYGVGLAGPLATFLDTVHADRGPAARAWADSLGRSLEPIPVDDAAASSGASPRTLLLNVNHVGDIERARELPPPPPPLVGVVGWKDAGKTTVAVALVQALVARGLRVAAFKHGHHFQLDTPGTDSWRLRHDGGASSVLLAGPEGWGSFGDWGPAGEPAWATLVRRHASGADVVVAEGWKEAPVPRIEVRRPGAGEGRALPGGDTLAVVDGDDIRDPALGARLAGLVADRFLLPGAA